MLEEAVVQLGVVASHLKLLGLIEEVALGEVALVTAPMAQLTLEVVVVEMAELEALALLF